MEVIGVQQLDDSGRFSRFDVYGPDQVHLARARFEELRAASARPEEPFANAATRVFEESFHCARRRDWARHARRLAPRFRFVDRRRLVQLELDAERYLEYVRELGDMAVARYQVVLLATRGERLALFWTHNELAEGDVGSSEIDSLQLVEVSERDEIDALVRFDDDAKDAAYAELDARYAATEGSALASRARGGFSRAVAARDWKSLAALCQPGFVERDHRRLTVLRTTNSLEEWLQNLRSVVALAPDLTLRFDHVRNASRGFLWRVVWSGTRDGGRFEIPLVGVFEIDEAGRFASADTWDAEGLDAARARFEEIVAQTAPSAERFANTAARAVRAAVASFAARDWERHEQQLVPGFRYSDRRKLTRVELDRDGYVAFIRSVGDMASTGLTVELLATRGERLALHRTRTEIEGGDVGPSEIVSLSLCETSPRGEVARLSRFDSEDQPAALAELDARWEASEATVHRRTSAVVRAYRESAALHAWDEMAALVSPSLVFDDHRPLALGLIGRERWIASLHALAALAPDVRLHVDHLRTAERGFLIAGDWRGTRDGGAFESPWTGVLELDEQGKIARIDAFADEQPGAALARFEELGRNAARDPLRIPPNSATRALDGWFAGTASGDMGAVRALYAESYSLDDRRALLRGAFDLESAVANARFFSEGWRWARTLLATAGDRLALWHILFTTGEASAASELEILELDEVDGEGRIVRIVLFDPDARAAASAELFERYAATGADGMPAFAIEFLRAMSARDLVRARATLPDDFAFDDHRRTGVGRLASADAYIASVAALHELSPDVRIDSLYRVAGAVHGLVDVARMSGTNSEKGEFESVFARIRLFEGERAIGAELFELEDLDVALARFEELGESAPRDPLRIPPNAATRATDRQWAHWEAEEWAALGELVAGVAFEDRRRMIRLSGGSELLLADFRHLSAARWLPKRSLLATAGERLSLEQMLWTVRQGGHAAEIELLRVTEVDAGGGTVAIVIFDPDARAAASAELFERYVRLGADGMPASQMEFLRAICARDLSRMRAALPDDYFVDDHRRLGLGRVEGADAYVASLAAAHGLSREMRIDELYQLAAAQHARLSVARMWGTNTEGGDFETFAVWLTLHENERLVGSEYFDLEAIDAALARFEELRVSAARDPLAIPPNAAMRAQDRFSPAMAQRDWTALRSFAREDFRYEDRGKRAQLSGDVETWIVSVEFNNTLPGFRAEREIIGTLGERILLQHLVWTSGPEDGRLENPRISLLEVDADGRLQAVILFDPEDRAAAFEEAEARFIAGEAATVGGQASVAALNGALARQDWSALRESLTDGFEMRDFRTLGHGVLTRDAHVDSMRVLATLGSRVRVEHLRLLAWNRHGRVSVVRTAGLNEVGGEFEILALGVLISEGDRVALLERYDLADAERALARFEALCAEREKAGK
jgi:hypothetical protein